jgi:protein SCO1/2
MGILLQGFGGARRSTSRTIRVIAAGAAVVVSSLLACPLLLAEPAKKDAPAGDPQAAPFSRTVTRVDVPELSVVDQNGRSASLAELLGPREPVVVNFFFASCGSICPVMTATLSQMRERLDGEGRSVKTISITIDPDQDTPDVLKSYAGRFSAGPGWTFVTAEAAAIEAIQSAFGANAGGKFNHRALYYFRAARSDEWVRIEGLAGANDLVAEARGVLRGAVARK